MKRVSSWREALLVIVFLAPALALVGVFTIWPVVWALVQSFTNRSLVGVGALETSWVGLDNYERLLEDDEFVSSLARTGVSVLASAIIGQTLLGFMVAYLITSRPRWSLRFAPVFAAIFILPLAVPETVAGLAWASLTNGTPDGLANRFLDLFGVGPVRWLQDYALETIIVVNIWRGIPFAMVLFAAALASVPRETLEASMVDGASWWQQLRRVTLPIIRPQIVLFLLLTTITTFGVFGLVYFLTRGGPGSATTLVSIYIYNNSFRFFEIGYGSAAGVVMLVILLLLGLYYVRLMREQV
jgi:multiple sugar transport system permease protein